MSRKVLKSLGSKPTLVEMYESQTKKIYNDWVHVPKRYWNKFLVLQEELQNSAIGLLGYTEIVLVSMKQWVKDNKLSSVPYHIFISDFCVNKFMRIHSKKSIQISNDQSHVIDNDELTLLRYYIQKRKTDPNYTIKMAIHDLAPLLSKECVELYRKDMNLHMNALMTLAEEYGAKIVNLEAIIEAANGG